MEQIERIVELMTRVAKEHSGDICSVQCCLQVDQYGRIHLYDRYHDNSGGCIATVESAAAILSTLEGITH